MACSTVRTSSNFNHPPPSGQFNGVHDLPAAGCSGGCGCGCPQFLRGASFAAALHRLEFTLDIPDGPVPDMSTVCPNANIHAEQLMGVSRRTLPRNSRGSHARPEHHEICRRLLRGLLAV